MKNILTIVIIVFASISAVIANKKPLSPLRIAVIENQYEHTEKYLDQYKIPYTMVKYRDLENEAIYTSYDVMFFPCGVEMPVSSSVNILSQGSHLQGISLNDQPYKIDMEKVGASIRNFISRGGSVYFSDFSFRYLQESFHPFTFYKDQPYLGFPSESKATPSGELSAYLIPSKVTLNMYQAGWIVPADVTGAKVFLTGECDTPLGTKTAVLGALFHRGDGVAVYTTYHEPRDTYGIMRYLIFRTIYNRHAKEALSYVSRWEQNLHSMIIDQPLYGETQRTYRMKVNKGGNYLYFNAQGGIWQIDIFDTKGSLLFSQENTGNIFQYHFSVPISGTVWVKIIPLDTQKNYVYTATTATGFRVFPYYIRILLTLFVGFAVFMYVSYVRRQRFRGRGHSSGATTR